MCNRVTWISDEKVTELFEELADLRERVKTEYQRGREDAAFDAEAVAEPFFLSRFDQIDEDAWAVFVNILAAARGDWHMKSIKYYYNVHMPECEDKHCGGCIPIHPDDLKDMKK